MLASVTKPFSLWELLQLQIQVLGTPMVVSISQAHFQDQFLVAILGFERIQNIRQAAVEFDVDNSARDLSNASFELCHLDLSFRDVTYKASAPEMISVSSVVILAWRVRL